VPRPSGPACDIGAYEVAPAAVTTGAASGTTTTAATIAGTVTANAGVATGGASTHFEFGTSTSYGSSTAAQVVNGTSPVAVSAALSGLAPNTTYHYRLVATAVDGTTMGADQIFTTAAVPSGRAPTLQGLVISPAALRAATSGASIARSVRTGATISYRDSEAATTTFVVLASRRGVREGGRCVKSTKRNGGKRVHHCTRYVSFGGFSHLDSVGANRFHFTGRVGGRKLKPGAYRLSATPRLARMLGSAVKASFRIIR
jgi:hypothetical protein